MPTCTGNCSIWRTSGAKMTSIWGFSQIYIFLILFNLLTIFFSSTSSAMLFFSHLQMFWWKIEKNWIVKIGHARKSIWPSYAFTPLPIIWKQWIWPSSPTHMLNFLYNPADCTLFYCHFNRLLDCLSLRNWFFSIKCVWLILKRNWLLMHLWLSFDAISLLTFDEFKNKLRNDILRPPEDEEMNWKHFSP